MFPNPSETPKFATFPPKVPLPQALCMKRAQAIQHCMDSILSVSLQLTQSALQMTKNGRSSSMISRLAGYVVGY